MNWTTVHKAKYANTDHLVEGHHSVSICHRYYACKMYKVQENQVDPRTKKVTVCPVSSKCSSITASLVTRGEKSTHIRQSVRSIDTFLFIFEKTGTDSTSSLK